MGMVDEVSARLDAALEGRYRVERELGRGGMGVVYLAHDLKHGRPVAIKVLRLDLAEAVGEERFAREIEIAARLNHPNILGLHDSGRAEGLHYFVMPYVEGESLREILDREGRLGLDRAVSYAREIAGALAYAHERGLVHRDIKPENVLFQAGHAIVCDFGIAKATAEASLDTLTRTGTSVGTFTYMSPEQLSEGALVDGRSDVYALGCLLHEMLGGDAPFTASTPQAAMARKLMGELPDRSPWPDVPESVWEVVLQALASDPDERFESAHAFAGALGHATTEMAVVRSRRRRSRGRLLRVAGATAGVVAIAATGAWLSERLGAPTYERLGVLPLANGSGDPREDFYVRGVYEDLVSEMQRAGLRVTNPSTARRLTESGAPVAEIAERLEADALLEGSVERIGPRVVVEIRLVDGSTEDLVWSEAFSAAQIDVVDLLHQITLAVAEETGAELAPEAVAALREAASVDPVLYELLLQARFEAFKLTRDGIDEAERLYQRAVQRDSTSTRAWQGLVDLWAFRVQHGYVPANVARQRRDSIVAVAPVSGLGISERALEHTWFEWQQARWTEAEEEFLEVLEARPSDSRMRAYYALLLLYLGRDAEGEREAVRAAREAPDDPLVQGLYGQVLNALHRYDDAEAAMTRARTFEPDAPILLSTLRTTYHLQGRDSLAIESWRDSYRSLGDLEALGALDAGYAAGGYEAALRSVAELFVDRYDRNVDRNDDGVRDVSVWQIGTLYTRAGMYDDAIEYLTLAADEGDTNAPYLSIDPIFDPMRDDPRFQRLVDRLQLPR